MFRMRPVVTISVCTKGKSCSFIPREPPRVSFALLCFCSEGKCLHTFQEQAVQHRVACVHQATLKATYAVIYIEVDDLGSASFFDARHYQRHCEESGSVPLPSCELCRRVNSRVILRSERRCQGRQAPFVGGLESIGWVPGLFPS